MCPSGCCTGRRRENSTERFRKVARLGGSQELIDGEGISFRCVAGIAAGCAIGAVSTTWRDAIEVEKELIPGGPRVVEMALAETGADASLGSMVSGS